MRVPKPTYERVFLCMYIRENIFVIYDVSKICWSQLLTKTMRTKYIAGVKANGGLINQDSKNIIKTNNLKSWDNTITLWLVVNMISKSCAVWSFDNYLILENWCVWLLSWEKRRHMKEIWFFETIEFVKGWFLIFCYNFHHDNH